MDAIRKKAMPGCNVLAIKDGNIIFQKAYGHYTYEAHQPSILSSVYDLASITKILATTLSLMRLYDEGKIDLSQKTAYYLPELQNSNIGELKIEKLLLHEAGLAAYTPYYKRLLTNQNSIADSYKSYTKKPGFENRITNNIYIRNDIKDSFYQAIIDSKVTEHPSYVYSDNDFILLGKIVERISGKNLDEYITDEFYKPMGLHQICFLPYGKISTELLVPSIRDGDFRQTELRGFVHDPGAALFGGVAGHAGLFGNAENVAAIMQMLLNGGTWKGKKYLQRRTIELFTSYASTLSRRGLGFDKPEKDNPTQKDGYPSRYSSPKCFGHTGFTGTCVWADPEVNLIYVLLANRNYPAENELFKTMNIRSEVLDKIYESIIP